MQIQEGVWVTMWDDDDDKIQRGVAKLTYTQMWPAQETKGGMKRQKRKEKKVKKYYIKIRQKPGEREGRSEIRVIEARREQRYKSHRETEKKGRGIKSMSKTRIQRGPRVEREPDCPRIFVVFCFVFSCWSGRRRKTEKRKWQKRWVTKEIETPDTVTYIEETVGAIIRSILLLFEPSPSFHGPPINSHENVKPLQDGPWGMFVSPIPRKKLQIGNQSCRTPMTMFLHTSVNARGRQNQSRHGWASLKTHDRMYFIMYAVGSSWSRNKSSKPKISWLKPSRAYASWLVDGQGWLRRWMTRT